MSFLNPQGFLGLLLALPIIAVYLLRLQYTNYVVPSISLWQSVLQDRNANKPWQKFTKHWLLFLQLLVLMMITISLAQPVLPAPLPLRERIYILVDISASMLAKSDQDVSRFDRAADELHRTLSTFRNSDNLTLITVGNNPRVVIRNADVSQINQELNTLSPTHGAADWAAVGQLTRSLAGEQETGDVTTIIVSDFTSNGPASLDATASSDAPFPGELFVINVGDESPNAGIVHFSTRRSEQNVTIFIRIQNAGPAAVRTLDILADGILFERQSIALRANEDAVLTFNDIPAGSWVEAKLLESDALTVDDRAWAALDTSGSSTALLVTSGNRFLAQALANLPTVTFHQTENLTVEDATSIDDSMLVVDVSPLPDLPQANMWLIAPDGETECGIPGSEFTQPAHVSGQWQHPLLQYVDWSDVHLQRVRRYQIPDSAELLLYSSQLPILWTVESARYRVVCTAFQLQDSDLPLRLAFPILTSNIVGWLSPHLSTEPQSPLTPGELWRPSLPANTINAVLIDPHNIKTNISVDGSGIVLDKVGLYRYIATTPASQQTYNVAVSLMNSQESDLRQKETLVTMVKSASVGNALSQLDVSRWTTGLAIILCCLEAVLWWGRGYRVTKKALFPFVFRSRNLFAMVMRLVMLMCLIGAFFGIRFKQKVRDLGIVFVVDRSDSSRESWVEQQTFIKQVLDNKTARDQAAIVLFGRQAWVDRSFSPDGHLAEFASLPNRDATDIEQAVRLASALIPQELVGRIVLMSDGLETTGQGQKALITAMDQGQDVLLLKTGSGVPSSEVWIDHLDVPSSIYPGDQVPIQVSLATNKSQTVRINWSIASQVGYTYFDLSKSESIYQFSYQALSPGFVPVRVCIEPVEDHYVDNNCADNWLVVQGTPQILIVAESPEGANLAAAIRAGGMDVVEAEPALMPQTIEELAGYSAIVLVNTPVRDLPRLSLSILDSYISDLGGGLIAAGGPTSFGVGGWLGTPLEQVLPVEMRVQDPQRFPPVVMALVIDTSGSMASVERGTAKITLAAEAALRVTESLNAGDTLLVVGYSDSVDHTTGPVQVDGVRDKMQRQLYGLRAGGGGIFVYESLDYTLNLLEAIPDQANVQRQVLLLADGGDAEHQPGAINLASEAADAGISISSISIGSGEDVIFLQGLADAGQGRYYLAATASDLPAIFTEEVLRVKRSYIVEETFTPQIGQIWSPLADFTSYPSLYGYVATAPKTTSEIILYAGEGDPILAVWQYGLGRSVAWTSDVVDRWSADWITWDAFASFWNAVLRDVLMQGMDQDVEINISDAGEVARVEIDIAALEQGEELDGLDLNLRFSGKVQDADDIIVRLEQTAPGRYSAEVPNLQSHPYLVRLYGDRNFVYGWAPPPAKEYLPADADTAMARLAAQSGGRIISSHEDVVKRNLTSQRQAQSLTLSFVLASALLWVSNVVWRRLSLSWAGILGSVFRKMNFRRMAEKRKQKPKVAIETSTVSELKDRKMKQLEPEYRIEGQLLDHNNEDKGEVKVLPLEPAVGQFREDDRAGQDLNLAARLRDRLRGTDTDEG